MDGATHYIMGVQSWGKAKGGIWVEGGVSYIMFLENMAINTTYIIQECTKPSESDCVHQFIRLRYARKHSTNCAP